MGGPCNTYRGEVRCIQGCGGEKLKDRDHLEGLGVDGRIILRWIYRKWFGATWTGLIWFQNRDRWWALVNEVMNLQVP